MTKRYLTVCGTTLALLAAAVLLIPVGVTSAESVKDFHADGASGEPMLGVQASSDGPERPVVYARSNYVWPYASGPYYGDVDVERGDNKHVLRTLVGSFRVGMGNGTIGLPESLQTPTKFDRLAAQYFVAMADARSVKPMLAAIEESGGAVVAGFPNRGVVARLTEGALASVQSVAGVVVEPYHAAYKLDPRIGRTPLLDPVKALSSVYELDVMLFKGENAQIAAAAVAAIGGNVKLITSDSLIVEIDRSRLHLLASIEAVQAVVENLPILTRAEETTTAMMTGGYNAGAVPYHDVGIDGSGGADADTQVMMVLDSGISLDAGDLSNERADAGTPSSTHRKVRLYESAGQFAGGAGDLLGCDAPPQGGSTHGHVVSATAMGWATNVDVGTYGAGWIGFDQDTNPWELDGVAPGAVLIAYDGQITPPSTSCADPEQDTISPGDLYTTPAAGSLGESYAYTDGNTPTGARVTNFSWGVDSNIYTSGSNDIDNFLFEKEDAMVFVSAGNAGGDDDTDGIPDLDTLGAPATTKNGLAIGASFGSGIGANFTESRAGFSSTGPAVNDTTINRIAPQLMAPGSDGGNGGLSSAFACRSDDNDQLDPVGCDVVQGNSGTSFASPAAAGAGLLVRDYFAQGFYPDGTNGNPGNATDEVASISGAMLKATLVASADFMTGANLAREWRGNNEQGWGRIQLDNVLPLQSWPASPTGLVVHDAGLTGGGVSDLTLAGGIDIAGAGSSATTFEICNDQEEIRVALAWLDGGAGAGLVNDLHLEVESPSGDIYYGNYFTDDLNRNFSLDTDEDCPSIDGSPAGTYDASGFSLEAGGCANALRDTFNNIEAVVLTPNPGGTCSGGQNSGADCSTESECPGSACVASGPSQVEQGAWDIRILSGAGTTNDQKYAVAIAGGVCIGSSARFDKGSYTCNQQANVLISDPGDPGGNCPVTPTAGDVAARTTVEVLDSLGQLVDCEGPRCAVPGTGVGFIQNGNRYESAAPIQLTDATARVPANGVLDVRSGDKIRVTYVDQLDDGGNCVDDLNAVRVNTANVNCEVQLGLGGVAFAQFGQNTFVLVEGGCETNLRGLREFGFPDRYMDEGERIHYHFGFASTENQDLQNVEASLRCVLTDTDSDEECLPTNPTTATCADPNRENNTPCTGLMSILDSPKSIGLLPSGTAQGANFVIEMADSGIPDLEEIELILDITADTSGKTAEATAVSRHVLDADDDVKRYSTDFVGGGSETTDRNNDEIIDNPVTYQGVNQLEHDYRFETISYENMTSTGKNLGIRGPWDFDLNDGGFVAGLAAITNESTITDTIANWSEDKNFNNVNDGRCTLDQTRICNADGGVDVVACAGLANPRCDSIEDRDPVNGILDKSWNLLGGCGWQTRPTSVCSIQPGGILRGCFDNDDCRGTCQNALDPLNSSFTLCDVNGDCTLAGETCVGQAGTCTGGAATTGGAWHTGLIRARTEGGVSCLGQTSAEQCESYDPVLSGSTGTRLWWELLVTPELQKVNDDTFRVEILDYAMNMAIDLEDNNVAYTWEFDVDTQEIIPTDLFADGGITNIGGGPYGAVKAEQSGGSAGLTFGFNLFSPVVGQCSITAGTCTADAGVEGCPPGETCVRNGTVGGNRHGKNACYFENGNVPSSLLVNAAANIGLAGGCRTCVPSEIRSDDDIDNNVAGGTDEWVLPNGPQRNFDLTAWNGPDMRFTTLEDIQGDAGETFRGALGLINYERTSSSDPTPAPGFGISIDDALVQWSEIGRVPDTTTCGPAGSGGNGACATLEADTTQTYEGNTVLTISLWEETVDPAGNDCDLDGTPDPGPVTDCDGDSTPDLPVKVTSEAEVTGEIVFLNLTSTPDLYRGEIVVSALIDVDEVLFIEQVGTDNPTVLVTYVDNEDGTGNICQNDVSPAEQGRVQDATTVFLTTCTMSVLNGIVSDNGDTDAFADTDETVDMKITVLNTCGIPVQDCVALLSSSDPKVECILNSQVSLGDFAEDQLKVTTDAFQWVVANVDRAPLTPFDEYAAQFRVSIACGDDFDALSVPQLLNLELDLDLADPGSGPFEFIEPFESDLIGGTTFANNNMDATLNTVALADGQRCQYADPDWVNSNVYGSSDAAICFPGVNDAHRLSIWWDIDGPAQTEGGRAYLGTRSLRYGAYQAGGGYTGPTSTMEGVESVAPINLSGTEVAKLSFKLQASMIDNRISNAPLDETWDGVTVSAQVADGAGVGVGDWIKLQAFQAPYDQQKSNGFIACFFDPTDDGTTEDDFFDPTDPERELGPSTSCFPGFQYTWIGETVLPYSPNNTGHPSVLEGTGLAGTSGPGTWIETKFDLSRFLGKRIRLRLMHSTMKFETVELWADIGLPADDPREDGAWIDDLRIDKALGAPAVLIADTTNDTLADSCAQTCGSIAAPSAVLVADPTATSAPGQLVNLDATGSSLDLCPNGSIQYRFLSGATVVRSWSDNPFYVDAPFLDTTYGVQIRCSSDPTCNDSDVQGVTVACPLGTGGKVQFPSTLSFGDGDSVEIPDDDRDLLRFAAVGDPVAITTGNLRTPDQSVAWSYVSVIDYAAAGDTTYDVSGLNPSPDTGAWFLAKTAPNESPACNESWGNVPRDGTLP